MRQKKGVVRKQLKSSSLLASFSAAINGLFYAMDERNIKIHYAVALLVALLSVLLPLESIDRIILYILIALVVSLELLNSAFERFIDFHVKSFEPEIKKAKDMAAGAVLIVSLLALGVGIWILGKYFV